MADTRKEHEVLWDLIKETRFCMLAHRHTDGSLHSHPLTTQNRELGEDGCIYFFVAKDSEVGERLQHDGNVNLSYANPKEDTWVSVTGTARISNDMGKRKELFDAMDKAWFDSAEDPKMELVEVKIEEAEYWNVKENKLLQLLKIGKAALGGSRPKLGEHKEVHFNN